MPDSAVSDITRRTFALSAATAPAAQFTRGVAFGSGNVGGGLERLTAKASLAGTDKAYALLTHAGATDRQGRRSADLVKGLLGDRLVALLSPEHGLSGSAAAGEKIGDGRDTATGLPVYSLYGTRREPPAELLERINCLIVDLQDVGIRAFTYAATMVDAIREAATKGVRVLVLDRPNPLGGLSIDGSRPEPGFTSDVAALQLPFRHGMTIGEIARLVHWQLKLTNKLNVVKCIDWSRTLGTEIYRGKMASAFVPPSPNLRSPQAVLAYAASVLVEGTNLSEGRGTARPFETIGAPWCDGERLAAAMAELALPGVRFTPLGFAPSTSKHAGKRCGGVQLEVVDERNYDPLLTGLSLIAATYRLHPGQFAFLPGKRPFFDLLIGNGWVRSKLLAGEPPTAIVKSWQGDVKAFKAERKDFLLY